MILGIIVINITVVSNEDLHVVVLLLTYNFGILTFVLYLLNL